MSAPQVSVVMPVRDGARHLAAAVDSILSQTLTSLELIVIDDGSRDRTPELLRAYADTDTRVRLLSQPAVGISQALNRGLQAARAPLVARMDADDIALPHRLARQVAELDASGDTVVLGGACGLIDEAGRPCGALRYPVDAQAVIAELRRRNPLVHASVVMRREAALAVGGYRPGFLLCEDYDLWLRLAERGGIRNLDDVILLHRERPEQTAWRGHQQRIVSVLAAQACARLRAQGRAEPPIPRRPIDRGFLRACGMGRAEIGLAVADAALETAVAARRRGYLSSAAAAGGLALRQPVGLRRKLSMAKRLARRPRPPSSSH